MILLVGTSLGTLLAETPESFSWQQPQAKVLPKGDLEWAPKDFVFKTGASVRYIDFENGKDTNAGTTKDVPWKHHPWDANARGKAAACTGIQTYVFKRGVIYRGSLQARDSGKPGNPIRLTSDPSWGRGEASIFGSRRLTDGWKRCDVKTAPGAPEPGKIWYQDFGTSIHPKGLWEIRDDKDVRIHVARSPNWTITNPDDPHTQWHEWEAPLDRKDSKMRKAKKALMGKLRWGAVGVDSKVFTAADPDYYMGGHIVSERFQPPHGNMNGFTFAAIHKYNPKLHAVSVDGRGSFKKGQRYVIENLLALLDEPGEFYFDVKYDTKSSHDMMMVPAKGFKPKFPGRLYVRLPDDKDPNTAILEMPVRRWPVEIIHQKHIVIEGLRFSFDDNFMWANGWPMGLQEPTAIRIMGDCQDITVRHCNFRYVSSVMRCYARPENNDRLAMIEPEWAKNWKVDYMDDISFMDCDVRHSDRSAINISSGSGRSNGNLAGELGDVRVMRNRFYDIAGRRGGSPHSSVPVIRITYPETAEVAGNIIDFCYGAGIEVKGGKDRGYHIECPLSRILIYNNKVVNSMLGCNDYGGIEMWEGGPFYVFNNISGNSVGYKNDRFNATPRRRGTTTLDDSWLTQGQAYYMDGGYKNFLFNNIAWGKTNDMKDKYRNRCGIQTVLGYQNHYINNTIYNFLYPISGSAGDRASILGNVITDASLGFISFGRGDDLALLGGGVTGGEKTMHLVGTNAYGNNIYSGTPEKFLVSIKGIGGANIEELRESYKKFPIRYSNPGKMDPNPLRDQENHDFRLNPESAAVDHGVKFFIPWSLSATVGEWYFWRDTRDPTRVLGENFYMTEEYLTRNMYYDIPRNSLQVPGATVDSYTHGPLEDWLPGALAFNGTSTYAVLTDEKMKKSYLAAYSRGVDEKGRKKIVKRTLPYPGEKRKTVDIGNTNFLIEIYFRTGRKGKKEILVSKLATAGYQLAINENGNPALLLKAGKKSEIVTAGTSVTDGKWHHVLVEVDRAAKTAQFYCDGKTEPVQSIHLASNLPLSNPADFLVGRGPVGDYFKGAIDYLRVCRSTLADSRTSIGELYAWQFDGPILRDFRGKKPTGKKRDAGAIELE